MSCWVAFFGGSRGVFFFLLCEMFGFFGFFFYFYQLAVGCSQLSKLAALNIILSHIILPLN